MNVFVVLSFTVFLTNVHGFPENTRYVENNIELGPENEHVASLKAILFNSTKVKLKVDCKPNNPTENARVKVRWLLRSTPCAQLSPLTVDDNYDSLLDSPEAILPNEKSFSFIVSGMNSVGKCAPDDSCYADWDYCSCGGLDGPEVCVIPDLSDKVSIRKSTKKQSKNDDDSVVLSEEKEDDVKKNEDDDVETAAKEEKPTSVNETLAAESRRRRASDTKTLKESQNNNVIATTWKPGPYFLIIEIQRDVEQTPKTKNLTLSVSYTVEFVGPHGYLSLLDYPLIVFYGAMCVLYAFFCILWLVFCAMHWKDLLRVQFWIGAVIALGLIEQAVFLGEYEHLNNTGTLVKSAEMVAELISVLKRTLARVLVLIVSLGYGIVKPRLGSIMNNVAAICICYFVFATIESGLRLFHSRNDPSTKALIATIPLSVTDSIICWWVFTSLTMTLKNLKLRRNIVKLTLYRHFFNTLIFCVIAAIVFMLWAIRMHRMPECVTDWKELWIDDAYWQLLFSIVLGVIIFLWRPSQNNKRYAFSPLMDNEDDEQEEPMLEAASTNFDDQVKIRKNVAGPQRIMQTTDKNEDDHLSWVEENIPTSGFDTALPSLLDSDEEVMTTKLEMSKQR